MAQWLECWTCSKGGSPRFKSPFSHKISWVSLSQSFSISQVSCEDTTGEEGTLSTTLSSLEEKQHANTTTIRFDSIQGWDLSLPQTCSTHSVLGSRISHHSSLTCFMSHHLRSFCLGKFWWWTSYYRMEFCSEVSPSPLIFGFHKKLKSFLFLKTFL